MTALKDRKTKPASAPYSRLGPKSKHRRRPKKRSCWKPFVWKPAASPHQRCTPYNVARNAISALFLAAVSLE
jgi:hypothetical protein